MTFEEKKNLKKAIEIKQNKLYEAFKKLVHIRDVSINGERKR